MLHMDSFFAFNKQFLRSWKSKAEDTIVSQMMMCKYMSHNVAHEDTFQGSDKGPQRAQVFHPPIKNNGHWGKVYVVAALVPATQVRSIRIFLSI